MIFSPKHVIKLPENKLENMVSGCHFPLLLSEDSICFLYLALEGENVATFKLMSWILFLDHN